MVTLTPADLISRPTEVGDDSGAPLVRQLPPGVQLADIFLRLCHLPNCLWLDSARQTSGLGRYSFLTADPIEIIESGDDESDPFGKLSSYAAFLDRQPPIEGLPPFQGGIAGVFGYELGRTLEPIPAANHDDLPTPPLCLGLYDWVICFDHLTRQGWIISQGWPETDPVKRRQVAAKRYEQILWWLDCTPTAFPVLPARGSSSAHLAPQFPTPLHASLTSTFSPEGFRNAVGDVVDYIRKGDVFQVNLAQRLLFPDRHGSAALYLRMRSRNAAPFAGYFDGGDWQVISASPERFLKVQDRCVETRPIKGTCPRTGDSEIDGHLGESLLASLKDRAENVMIVDLMRNDLSRVCKDESIEVPQLCSLELYEYVQHLVSVVEGELLPDATVVDLLRACFPGGSITGAPKIRAMQIIAELEPTSRGPYCGSLGYISSGGAMDLSILIRTVTSRDGWLQLPVGGGITSKSDPVKEEQETWDKAKGMLQAVL